MTKNKKNKTNKPHDYAEDEEDYGYEVKWEGNGENEDDIDEIDSNELGDLLKDTFNKMYRQNNLQENHQIISQSEEEYNEEDDME